MSEYGLHKPKPPTHIPDVQAPPPPPSPRLCVYPNCALARLHIHEVRDGFEYVLLTDGGIYPPRREIQADAEILMDALRAFVNRVSERIRRIPERQEFAMYDELAATEKELQ
jgi:hypothetical protein